MKLEVIRTGARRTIEPSTQSADGSSRNDFQPRSPLLVKQPKTRAKGGAAWVEMTAVPLYGGSSEQAILFGPHQLKT